MAKTLADLRPAERLRLGTATHEAAHALLAALSGATVDRAEVLSSGHHTCPNGHAVAGVTRYFHSPISPAFAADIHAAGTVGEALFQHGPNPTSHQMAALLAHHRQDHDELAALARPRRELPSAALSAVLPLMLRLREPVARLAGQLHVEREIDHAAVLAALGVPSADELPQYAAMIRSGATPGSFKVSVPVRF